jgi:hypothetical protein
MELTPDPAREIARLRRRWPHAEIVLHHRARAVILEVRDGGRVVAIERFGADGTVGAPGSALPMAA